MSGISSLLKSIKEEGVPETMHRSAIYRARKAACNKENEYGKLIEVINVVFEDGTDMKIGIANPLANLYNNCIESEHFSKIVKEGLDRYPSSPSRPWHLVVYQDGIDPTDGLAKHHFRKSSVYYTTFLEFGMRALCHEETWHTVCSMREHLAKQLRGGLCQLTTHVLQAFFNDTQNIQLSGVSLKLYTGETVKMFAKVGVILADEPAIKDMIGCKGHAGTKPCLLCKNATHHKPPGDATPLHLVSDYAKPICEPDFSKFIEHDDDSLKQLVQRLHELKPVLSNAEFEKKTQIFIFNYEPSTIILNERLRVNVVSCIMYDWGHIYVCDGIASDEFGMCISQFRKARDPETSYDEFGRYYEGWVVPGKREYAHLFSKEKIKNYNNKGGFSCIASDFLGLACILLRYFQNVVAPRGRLMPQVNSMIAVLQVVLMLQAVRSCKVNADELHAAISNHFFLFVLAYGTNVVRPKHHYSLHLGKMLRRFGTLLSTFVNERKHRIIKRFTKDRCNRSNWEINALEEVTVHALWELRLPFFNAIQSSLPRGRVFHALHDLFPGIADESFSLHTDLKINGGSTRTEDLVSYTFDGSMELGQLHMCVGISAGDTNTLWALVGRWTCIGQTKDGAWRSYRVTEDVYKVPASDLDTAFTYRMADNKESCCVFVPFECR